MNEVVNMNFCLNCGKELTGAKSKNKYCNVSCQKEYERKQYIEEWKAGNRSGLKGEYQISNAVREYMLEKAGFKCQKCGWNEINPFTGKIPLEIHHKDGDYANTTEENLEVLCPNCHSLTENFRGRGKGREERKSSYMTNTCIDCGTTISNTSIRCQSCEQKRRKKEFLSNLPISRGELKNRIRTEPFTSIARDYNISDNGLKRWIAAYGLPNTKTAIKQYTDEEWEII